jgi:hypothetical protein
MELTEYDIEVLDRFYRNELPEHELFILQSRMKDEQFADAVRSYLQTLSVIEQAGRFDLQQQLKSVQRQVQKTGYDKYKPPKGKNFGGAGIIISIAFVIICMIAFMFYTRRLNTETLKEVLPATEAVDTIYHYNVHTDTIIVDKPDSFQHIKPVVSDTIYIRTPIPVHQNDSVDHR